MTEKFNLSAVKEPKAFHAIFPILVLLGLLSLNVCFFGDGTLGGANQIALLLAAGIGSVIAVRLGYPWMYVRSRIVKSISDAMPSMLILLMIGALAGTWMLSGVVPAMIYYGLKILHPTFFLAATVIICSLVSLGTGSSWSTVATIGVALLGIGQALGFNSAIVAGAIVSGAYFGDKMSPLSDTTNLAPAMAGTDLFTHIRYMVITTVPSIILTIIIFAVIGFTKSMASSETGIERTLNTLQSTFYISPWLFIVPVVLIVVILKKTAPLPSLMIGTLLGAIFAVIFQPHIIREIAGFEGNYAEVSYVAVMKSMFGRISVITSDPKINDLLTTGGMGGMLNTIWLIISAMVFGGVMESCGLLAKITSYIIRLAVNTASLVASTVATCIFFNITASDQYLSIVVPGRMFAETYRKRKLKPELLSRTLEDSGTVTSVLIPWNTCGATQAAVLGVPVISYMPYAFFNIISPFMSIFIASINYKIRRIDDDESDDNVQSQNH
ncbi:MAG TPA: Na+/H+ antiporter NhaC [Salinivirgaceae bacterium]|nr:Na+/H+ antiporter NhaC [Salinivirgaceae bacterium]